MPSETTLLISRIGNRVEIIAHFSTLALFMPQQKLYFAGRNAESVLLSGLRLSVVVIGKDV